MTGEKVMFPGKDEPIGWNSLAETKAWIDEHLRIFGHEWRVGYTFKAIGEEPMRIIVRKTGKELKA